VIISHKYKFIFIKTGKVGGTSLEIALSQFLGSEDVITPLSKQDELERFRMGYPTAQNYQKHFSEMSPNEIRKSLKYNLLKVFSPEEKKILLSKRFPKRYRGHIGAGQVRELAGEDVWNDYLKFSIERNPWDRVVSLFHFQKKRPYQAYESVNELGFREFVLGGYGYQPNFELYSINGIPAMDRIIRYEDLGTGLSDLSRTLGLPADLSESMQNIKAKGGFRNSREYKSYFDEETKRVVDYQYAREISLFGYEF